jgi:Polyketide cyclase / dehydrase and lipid transport
VGVLICDAMQSFEFQIVVNCPLEKVFSIYQDIERWSNRSVFGDIRWAQGPPWEPGSRLRIDTRHPIRSTVDQVVTAFERNQRVSYISHVLGITCETRVTFVPVADDRTAVNVGMELVGTLSRALGFAIEPLIEKATKEFFADLKKECEAVARVGASSGASG